MRRNRARPAATAPALRLHGLFGEPGQLPDALHCETIAARSALHGWELAPHRHVRLHQVLLIAAGGGRAWLGPDVVELQPPALVNVPTGDVHAFSFLPDTQGWVLSVADEFVDEALGSAPDTRRALARAAVQTLPADRAQGMAAVMERLREEFDIGGTVVRNLVLRGLGTAALALAARSFEDGAGPGADLSGSHLLRRFEDLLDRHFAAHWGVGDYARALAVTPTHLTRVARAAAGVPASRLIDARLMREARRHLAYTSAPIGAVAEALGFTDPAHFSRVFQRTCGTSPREFRASVTQLGGLASRRHGAGGAG